MLLKKILLFIAGWVIIAIEGPIENFINISINKGINLQNLKSKSPTEIQFQISLRDFWKLRPVIKETGCNFKIVDKKGFPFIWSRMKKRQLLLVGGVIFVITMYILTSFVWFVKVESHRDLVYLDKKEIVTIARDNGLRPGILKKNINPRQIEKILISKLPEISWAGLEFQGTKATIRIVERKLPAEEYQDKDYKHLVAAKSGIIHEILVMVGQPLVQVGDVVEENQILISGLITAIPDENEEELQEENPSGENKLVKAKGIVRAKVWYESQGSQDLKEVINKRTGAKETAYYLNLPASKIVFKGSLKSTFMNYETETKGNSFPKLPFLEIPAEIVKVTFHEIEVKERNYSKDEAIRLIKNKLREGLKTTEGAKIVDEEIEILVDTHQKVMIKLVVEVIENIGKLVPVQ